MNCDEQFDVWKTQVTKLKSSLGSLVNTDPNNLIQHFFLQAIQQEFSKELESNKNTIKTILCLAVNEAETLSGNVRQRIQYFLDSKDFNSCLTLAPIRNM